MKLICWLARSKLGVDLHGPDEGLIHVGPKEKGTTSGWSNRAASPSSLNRGRITSQCFIGPFKARTASPIRQPLFLLTRVAFFLDSRNLQIKGKVMAEEVVELLSPRSLSQTNNVGKQEFEQGQSLANLQAKLLEVKTCIQGKPHVFSRLHTLNGIKHQEGVASLTSSDCPSEETSMGLSSRHGSLDECDCSLIGEVLKSIHMVNDLVEVLVKMVMMAETEISIEKEKVSLGQEEIKRKVLQIESMSAKVKEMERFSLSTNCLLNEMQQKVEDMVLETSRQRQRAAENEQELCRVKQDFESLRSYVSSLISVREMILSSEKHQTNEMQFERLVALASQLEGEKVKKEAEVKKLMTENIRLASLLDKKEAQLLAMNEQCKEMALKHL
ncbi:hypothetical protein IFM89_014746 [Coptis chinensis]|uniref:Uncharacterized protein n=1 Tax=Coptis chinensis TaxID=261450 RepID=A0A835INX8_9MAGN|nr:hypothetical protein IFM89_014746 [Coptis chinensis]